MKRLALSVMSVCLLSFASGCCWPGMPPLMNPWGGCANGQCGVNPYAAPPQGAMVPQGQVIQSNYAPIAQPIYTNTQVAYPQPIAAPAMAVESLPTYR